MSSFSQTKSLSYGTGAGDGKIMHFGLSDTPHLGAELSMDAGTAAPSLFALNLFTWNPHARIQSKGDWGPSIISRATSKMSLCPTRGGWAKKRAAIYFFVLEFSLSNR